MNLHVRPATLDDLDFLVRANASLALETEDLALDQTVLRAGVEKALNDPARGTYTVAILDSRPVGSLLVTREWSDWRNGWMWWIQSVFVDPRHRRQGVYRALHQDVLERARTQDDVKMVRLYVDRDNEGAREVYERMGMTVSRYDLMDQPV